MANNVCLEVVRPVLLLSDRTLIEEVDSLARGIFDEIGSGVVRSGNSNEIVRTIKSGSKTYPEEEIVYHHAMVTGMSRHFKDKVDRARLYLEEGVKNPQYHQQSEIDQTKPLEALMEELTQRHGLRDGEYPELVLDTAQIVSHPLAFNKRILAFSGSEKSNPEHFHLIRKMNELTRFVLNNSARAIAVTPPSELDGVVAVCETRVHDSQKLECFLEQSKMLLPSTVQLGPLEFGTKF
ncbi:MAG: hypothetical protein M3Q79_03470 [bacterium]|nr:hypothetical protein [bacterium]